MNFNIIVKERNKNIFSILCLKSIISQNYKNWRIIFFDDCSDDNTFELVKEFCEKEKIMNKVKLIRNQERMYGGYATFMGIKVSCYLDPDGISVFLDGDDIFCCNSVLKLLNKTYMDNVSCVGLINKRLNLRWKTDKNDIRDVVRKILNFKNHREEDIDLLYDLIQNDKDLEEKYCFKYESCFNRPVNRDFSYLKKIKKEELKKKMNLSALRSFRNSKLICIKKENYRHPNGRWVYFNDDFLLTLTVYKNLGKNEIIGDNPIYFYGYNMSASLDAKESWFNYKKRKETKSLEFDCDKYRDEDYEFILNQ